MCLIWNVVFFELLICCLQIDFFSDFDFWLEDGFQLFVWFIGDEKGFFQYGDYVFGWKDDVLQCVMDV